MGLEGEEVYVEGIKKSFKKIVVEIFKYKENDVYLGIGRIQNCKNMSRKEIFYVILYLKQ